MKICFLSLDSYPILTGRNSGYAGGAEIEQVNLARELATRGYDVSFVTYRYGRNQIESAGGIKVLKAYERGNAGEKNALLKYRIIWSSLRKAGADIYFHESGATGVLPFFCFADRSKFVHRIASDAVVLSKPLSGPPSFNRKIMEAFEIKRADVVIAQSRFQKRILKERFRVESIVIKNGLILPNVHYEKPAPPVVLWVGSISRVKNPELFIELAKSLPNARFEMVGGRGDPSPLYAKIAAAAQKLPNLKFHGFVPYHKVDEYFRRASLFVNTSSVEGFPNTFIQAWAHSTPVVSLNVDPDKVVQSGKLGFASGIFKQLVSDVTTLLEDEKLRKTMGKNARKYVKREHDVKKIAKEYLTVLSNIT